MRHLVKKRGSLLKRNPKLAKEWHPEKNGTLTPKDVTPGSNKKVWWKCKNGHEWLSIINNRKKNGCPYCSGHKVCKDNCLATLNPKLAKEWHPKKNGKLTPKDVTPGSNKKVWWLCKKGHEWQEEIYNRNKGYRCPYCSGQRVCVDNCLATKNPELTKEWHSEKNKNITAKDVTSGSGKKVWWKCKNGHEWIAVIAMRNNGSNCPYCSGLKASKDNCLATLNPKLAKEWHRKKNGKLSPKDVTLGSNKKVWWLCKKGHEWQEKISNRNKGYGCPYCSGHKVCKDNCLATLNPKLAKEWHPVKNGILTPKDVTLGSNKKVWWKCRKGHEWQAIIANRTKGNKCPYCSGKRACEDNCLATINPGLAKEWHPQKNGKLSPKDVTPGCYKKVWWKCFYGHEWRALISSRSNGRGCPGCFQMRRREGFYSYSRTPSVSIRRRK